MRLGVLLWPMYLLTEITSNNTQGKLLLLAATNEGPEDERRSIVAVVLGWNRLGGDYNADGW